MAKSKQLLTTRAFSEKVGVTPATVSSWLKKGKIKGKKEGRKWLIAESELEKLVAGNTASVRKAASVKAKSNADAGEKKAGPKRAKFKHSAKAPQSLAKNMNASAGGQTYSVETFSAMTFLTAFGVKNGLKRGV